MLWDVHIPRLSVSGSLAGGPPAIHHVRWLNGGTTAPCPGSGSDWARDAMPACCRIWFLVIAVVSAGVVGNPSRAVGGGQVDTDSVRSALAADREPPCRPWAEPNGVNFPS